MKAQDEINKIKRRFPLERSLSVDMRRDALEKQFRHMCKLLGKTRKSLSTVEREIDRVCSKIEEIDRGDW